MKLTYPIRLAYTCGRVTSVDNSDVVGVYVDASSSVDKSEPDAEVLTSSIAVTTISVERSLDRAVRPRRTRSAAALRLTTVDFTDDSNHPSAAVQQDVPAVTAVSCVNCPHTIITTGFTSPNKIKEHRVCPVSSLTLFNLYLHPNITGPRPWRSKVKWRHRSRDQSIRHMPFPTMSCGFSPMFVALSCCSIRRHDKSNDWFTRNYWEAYATNCVQAQYDKQSRYRRDTVRWASRWLFSLRQ